MLVCKNLLVTKRNYFQDILNRSISNQPLPWYKTLAKYYQRDEWELFDLRSDPTESVNIAENKSIQEIRKNLEIKLLKWQTETNDPWRCAPHAILQDKGEFQNHPQCLTLGI